MIAAMETPAPQPTDHGSASAEALPASGVPVLDGMAVLPLASRGPISRKTFTQWLDQAAAIATPDSAPVLMVIALDGLDDRHDDTLLDAAAWQLCEALGDEGLVCRLEQARLGVMVANDSYASPDAVGVALLGALARPFDGFSGRTQQGARLGTACWGKHGTTAEALFVAASYALHETQAPALDQAPAYDPAARIAVNRS